MRKRRPISDITVTDVRSCPFCGSRELEAYPIKSARQQVVATCIICRLCNARGPVVPIIKTAGGKQLREQSVRFAAWKWNGNYQLRTATDAAHPWEYTAAVTDAAGASADAVQYAAVSPAEDAAADAVEPAAPGTSDAVQDVEHVAISAEDAGALEVQATGSAESAAVGIADADAAVTVEPMPEDAGSAAGVQALECGQACQDAAAWTSPPVRPDGIRTNEELFAAAEAAGMNVYEYCDMTGDFL